MNNVATKKKNLIVSKTIWLLSFKCFSFKPSFLIEFAYSNFMVIIKLLNVLKDDPNVSSPPTFFPRFVCRHLKKS